MYELTVITKDENFEPVREILSRRGATIVHEEPVRKIHMFYPIKKERYGFLNVVKFEGASEALNDITADLKLRGDVLRFIVTKAKIVPAASGVEEPEVSVRRQAAKPASTKPSDQILTNEELERKIEEILK
ncbi:MAG TPA: 30S ribosomal protein S6 [Candidatus Paceibacterota bacterium]|nr:30S ribosomal protein S6 [Candidatus Paceibacterota bacterium]